MRIIELPYPYACRGIPPHHRSNTRFHLLTTGLFEFPEITLDEMTLALTHSKTIYGDVKTEDKYYRFEDDLYLETHHSLDEILMMSGAFPQTKWGMSAAVKELPVELRSMTTNFAPSYGGVYFAEAEIKKWKRVEVLDKEKEFAQVQSQINSGIKLVIDGDRLKLYATKAAPRWNIELVNEGDRRHWSSSAIVGPPSSQTFSIPAELTAEMIEFAKWSERDIGLKLYRSLTEDFDVTSELPAKPDALFANTRFLVKESKYSTIRIKPYGEEVETLGEIFRKSETVSNAMAFVHAFEKAATAPDADQISSALDNSAYFAAFWKICELLPDAYKVDPVAPSDDLDLDAELTSYGM